MSRSTRVIWHGRQSSARVQRRRRGADGAQELLRRSVLQDVRQRAAGEREVAKRWIKRQEDHAGVGKLGRDGARDLETRERRHARIEHDEIRPKLARQAERGLAVGGFADDLDVLLEREHRADGFAHGVVAVGNEDAYGHAESVDWSAPRTHERQGDARNECLEEERLRRLRYGRSRSS